MKALITLYLFYVALIVVTIVGYFMNVFALISGHPVGTELVLRIVGLAIGPFGALMGYFG